jgi:hypothetical protein
MTEAPAGVLRTGARGSAAALPIELFFDLVYVLAVTQLTHYLLEHLTLRGAGETLAPLAVVSSALVLIAAATSVLVGVVAMGLVIERRRLVAESQAVATAVEA